MDYNFTYMKLKFKNQQFQTDAAKAVTDVFQGQKNAALLEFTHDMGTDSGGFFDALSRWKRVQVRLIPISKRCSN